MMKFYRTIYPVGQGAFYGERFIENDIIKFQIVYDCGSTTSNKKGNTEALDKAITAFASKPADIDYMFVSHFDEDHVNGIIKLYNECKIKCIILPLIRYKWLAYASCRTLTSYRSLTRFLNFLDENQEIRVIMIGDEEDSFSADDVQYTPLLKRNFTVHRSGTALYQLATSSITQLVWEYIPINNFKYAISDIKLLEIKIEKLFSPPVSIDDIWSKAGVMDNKKCHEINDVYKKIFHDANQPSMIVYSGLQSDNPYTLTTRKFDKFFMYGYIPGFYESQRLSYGEACLYTGDCTLKRERCTDIYSILKNKVDHIGLIQLPHHGSWHNLTISRLKEKAQISLAGKVFFASFGTFNVYRHPSYKIIQDVLMNSAFFRGVTNLSASIYEEIILFP